MSKKELKMVKGGLKKGKKGVEMVKSDVDFAVSWEVKSLHA